MQTNELDKIFDDGKEDILPYLDLESARKINDSKKRVNFDVPAWILKEIDAKAKHLGFSRSAYIQHCLIEKLGIS